MGMGNNYIVLTIITRLIYEMENLLIFLENRVAGVAILILLTFSLLFSISWLARIFSWGKYKNQLESFDDMGSEPYFVSRFFANIINDFKHFLALVIVMIFAGLIIYSMAAADEFDQKMEALQLVIASLGGLLGSIIGYYFGESAARGRREWPLNIIQPDNNQILPQQTNTPSGEATITPAPTPSSFEND